MSLEEKHYNVSVTVGIAYIVDTLNREDVNEEYVEQYLEPAFLSQVIGCPQKEADRIINDKSQLLYDDISTFLFILRSRLKRRKVTDFSSRKDDELKLWMNRYGEVAIQCGVHMNFTIDEDFKKTLGDICDIVYDLADECQQYGTLSAFVTSCHFRLNG